jgi:hypothetical protein
VSSWIRGFARHPASEEGLNALVDGRLSSSRRAAVEAHVETCESCRASIAELRALKSMLAALPEATPARSFVLRPSSVLGGAELEAPARGRSARLWAPALAFSFLVLLLAVDLIGGTRGSGNSAGNSFASKSVSSSEDRALSNAPSAPAGDAASTAGQVPAAVQPQAGGAPPAVTAAAGAEAQRSAAEPPAGNTAVPAPPAAKPGGSGGGTDWLRVLEVLALVATLASSAYVWWYRSHAINRSGTGGPR